MAPELRALTTEEARTVFSALRLDLQAAMKAAATAENWSAAFWPREVALIQSLLIQSGFAAETLDAAVALYRKAAA